MSFSERIVVISSSIWVQGGLMMEEYVGRDEKNDARYDALDATATTSTPEREVLGQRNRVRKGPTGERGVPQSDQWKRNEAVINVGEDKITRIILLSEGPMSPYMHERLS